MVVLVFYHPTLGGVDKVLASLCITLSVELMIHQFNADSLAGHPKTAHQWQRSSGERSYTSYG